MDTQEKNSSLSSGNQLAPVPVLDAKGLARRRFTRASAGATGVILTLHSQPGMATYGQSVCISPSGFMSMKPGASAKPQQSCSYNRSHGYWKTHAYAWKGAGIDPTARFGKVFGCAGKYAGLADVTLMGVINPSKTVKAIDRNNVAMQCVAALLNARAARFQGIPSVLPEERLMEIWNSFVTKGYYSPGAGATPWSGAAIAAYLESTFR
ncbi:hypothetical protein ACHAC9_11850 [Massilia sp. CMS3.1]|uniref:hypothetical protein n=1 Tax=Massilia sp. CMS3.1 TaxID=3373083 RepID=UPI003EE78750